MFARQLLDTIQFVIPSFLPIQATLCEMFTLRDKTLVKRASQKSDAWFIECISKVLTCKTNWISSGFHQFQISEITPFFWILQHFRWSTTFGVLIRPILVLPARRGKKARCSPRASFVGLAMGTALIQTYYICLLSQVTYFFH